MASPERGIASPADSRKSETVRMAKNKSTSGKVQPREARPPTLRVRVCLAPGLWQFEDDDGQLYLAVKTPGWRPPPTRNW